MGIPRQLLRELYNFGSLQNTAEGVAFSLKNRLVETQLTAIGGVRVNDRAVPLGRIALCLDGARHHLAEDVSEAKPVAFPLRRTVEVVLDGLHLDEGHHRVELDFSVATYGPLCLGVEDVLAHDRPDGPERIPHDERDDYSADLVRARQAFVQDHSGVELEHVGAFSFDPARARGNIENFTGVAQVPIGFAGPIHIRGEHADGEFLAPMATTEGTLVASYNRGIKVLNLSGGVLATVSADAMQRAPVFIFESAREARDFSRWVESRIEEVRAAAEATSTHARLLYIDPYLSNRFAYLRFNYSTGDAAGQNMVGRATFAACQWILERATSVRGFFLEANLATDKKHSQVNIMRTRGKRVTAEATVERDLLVEHMRVTPEQLHHHASLGTIGAILSGASNNGAHSPNGITAMFIATGQDVANVAESAAAILYTDVTTDGNLYVSLTIPSLIVATYGGGTGLPTQRECLRVLGCTEPGSVTKLAEIIAGVALAGELSLGAAISSLDWVSSHERLGRNR